MDILGAVRSLQLPDWGVAGGAIRNTMWDHLHGFDAPSWLRDVDVVYFDPDRHITEDWVEKSLSEALPDYEWQAANEARMHEWQAKRVGRPVAPYTSTLDALKSWVETATPVGLRLEDDNELTVLAPLGLEDLFELRLRANPKCPDPRVFQHNLVEKRFLDHWPKLRLVE